jgi:hypothetical protein
MHRATAEGSGFSPAVAARGAGLAFAFSLYVALAAAATIIYPPLGVLFLFPVIVAIMAVAPTAKAAPRRLAFNLILVACVLLAVWPVYIFLKLGPSPILTPPRLVLYVVSAMWLYDMAVSPYRRAQFALAVRRSGWVARAVFCFFLLGLISLPLAEGRALAIPEFFRQAMIWLLPFCAVMTYCRRQRDFVMILKATTIGAIIVAVIALGEVASGQLMANALSPFISGDGEWLQNVQEQKIRDGIFRAQASHTHPLSLGEHMALAAPFALAFWLSARGKRARWLWGAGLALILLGAIATNARGAGLGMAASIIAMTAILTVRFLKSRRAYRFRPVAGLVAAIALLSAPLAGAGVYAVVSGKGGLSASNSTQARFDQVEQAWPKIVKRPILGHGPGRANRVLGFWGTGLTIDNFYLSLALDYGLPGPFAFLAMLAAFGIGGARRAATSPAAIRLFYLACLASAAAIAISRTVSSLTGNLTIIFVLIAAFAGASVTMSRRAGERVR